MKKWIPFLIFILLLVQVKAQTDELFYAENLLLDVNLNSDFNLIQEKDASQIDFVRADFQFYPIDSYNQEVISIKTEPKATEKDDSFEFYWKEPFPGKYSYSVESKVKTYNRFVKVYGKIPFPISYFESDIEEYLETTEKIDINEDIIEQASELAKGEDDMFKVVFNLASWTKQNINYSLDTKTAEASQKASWVLKNKYGVCDELTNLFIAMCRSLGIPARFVSGISYTNSQLFEEKWGLHGWAEVYFSGYGWVPFDPTYGQYGQLDPTHIKLRDSLDSDKSSTKFEWQARNVDLKPGSLSTNIEILEQGEKVQDLVDVDLKILSDEVSFGSFNLVEVELKNNQDYYVGLEISLGRPKEIKISGSGSQSKFVLLKPFEEKSVFFIISVTEDLSEKYMYTFPLEAVTSLGDSGDGSFRASSRNIKYTYSQVLNLMRQFEQQEEKVYSRNIEINCIPPNVIFVNESFNMSCEIKNKGNVFLNKLKVCLDAKQCQNIDLGIAQSKILDFEKTLYEIGEQEVSISAWNYEVNSLKLIRLIAEDKPIITIEKVVYPESIKYGPQFSVKFDLWKHSMSKPQNITIKFWFNDKETQWDLPQLESNQGFDVILEKNSLNLEKNNFKITVEFHDRKGNLYKTQYENSVPTQQPDLISRIEIWLSQTGRAIDALIAKIHLPKI